MATVSIYKRRHYNTVCVHSPSPNQSHADHQDLLQFFQASIINLPVTLTFYCTFHKHLEQKVQQNREEEKGRKRVSRQMARELLPTRPSHPNTSSFYNQHHHWNSLYLGLSCHVKIVKCKWSPRSLPVCACSCLEPRSCQSVHLPVKAI